MSVAFAALLCFGSCSSPAAPSAPVASVDVLSYLLGDSALWPRVGNHGQNQIVDLAREVHRYAMPRLPQPAEPAPARKEEPAFAMAGGPSSGIIEID